MLQVFRTCRPPWQEKEYFPKQVNYALDSYRQFYNKLVINEDFNLNETFPVLKILNSSIKKSLL